MVELPTGTVTFLLTDVEGSTALWQVAEEAMRLAAARHDALFEEVVQQHGGVHIRPRGEGDSRFAVFSSAPDAVAAAAAIQRAFATETWPTPSPIKVRIGIHTGEAQLREGDYYGTAVNRCARLRNLGHGGQTLLSEATAALTRERLPSGASLRDLGQHRLRDLTEPERVSQVVSPDLSTDFPPLASLDARPHNLPTHPTALLGRERELTDVRGLIEDGARLVTLTGPGGTGKTRLGLQVAAGLLEGVEQGAFLVELAPISDPALVPSTIAQALGVRDLGNRPIVDAVKEHLRARSVLLLLDNFEQVLPAAPVVADLLAACPGLAVVATSREPLRLRGEHEYAVPPLALPDARQSTTAKVVSDSPAVALFVQRARAVRADFVLSDENASAVAEVCARLDGLPLAIELAAARVRLLPPEAMARRLERRLPLLVGGARDLPARQQTLGNAIAWSYDLLDPAEQRLFRRLGAFVGGFTLEAAEAVCDFAGDLGIGVLDGVESLVAKSLLRQADGPDGEPRFTMLETIREYAAERLEASGDTPNMRRRHAEWLLALVERVDPEHTPNLVDWFDRLDAELDNARAALTWSRDDSDTPGLMLCLANGLAWYWYLRGHLGEVGWIETALAAHATPTADIEATRTRARGLRYLAIMGRSWMAPERRVALLGESVTLYRATGDRAGAAAAVSMLALHLRDLRDYPRARAAAEEALALSREANEAEVPRAMYHLASILYYERFVGTGSEDPRIPVIDSPAGSRDGATPEEPPAEAVQDITADEARALKLLDESLSIASRRGDVHQVAIVLAGGGGVGEWSHALGRYERARSAWADGLRLRWHNRELRAVCDCLDGLSRVSLALQQPERAARLSAAAGRLSEATEARRLPHAWPSREQDQAAVRSHLSDETLLAAWAEGRAMTLEQAVAYALDEQPSA